MFRYNQKGTQNYWWQSFLNLINEKSKSFIHAKDSQIDNHSSKKEAK
jgi:hypothetical protein